MQTRKRLSKHDLKTDAFTTNVFRAKEWAEGNLKTVIIGLVALIAVIATVWGATAYFAGQSQKAQELFGEAGVEIRSGNPEIAIAFLQKLIDEYSGDIMAGPAHFQLASLHFRERSFDNARVAWENYLDKYHGDALLTAGAWLGLGAIEEQAGFPENAIDKFEKAVEANPDGFQAPDYLRRLIRAALAVGDTTRALNAFERLETEYPTGNESLMIARQLLIEKGVLDPNQL